MTYVFEYALDGVTTERLVDSVENRNQSFRASMDHLKTSEVQKSSHIGKDKDGV